MPLCFPRAVSIFILLYINPPYSLLFNRLNYSYNPIHMTKSMIQHHKASRFELRSANHNFNVSRTCFRLRFIVSYIHIYAFGNEIIIIFLFFVSSFIVSFSYFILFHFVLHFFFRNYEIK